MASNFLIKSKILCKRSYYKVKKMLLGRTGRKPDSMSGVVVKRNTAKSVIWLVGTEDFGNLGDHEIAVAERHFFEKYFSDLEVIEISARNYWTHRHEMISQIYADDIIVGTGGGNFGNQYPESEKIRNDLIQTFPNHKIVIMPQTIWFTQDNDGIEKLQSAAELYGKHQNLILAVREKFSLEFAKEHFLNRIILVPDIALFDYDAVKRHIPEAKEKAAGKALLCLRNDLERNIDKEEKQKLIRLIKKNFKCVKQIDTQKDYLISTEKREAELGELFREIASADIVITDRLHGMVFAALTETPCIVFDNYNKKVLGIYEWLKELPYVRFKNSIYGIEQDIEELKAMRGHCFFRITGLEDRFVEFASEIRGE